MSFSKYRLCKYIFPVHGLSLHSLHSLKSMLTCSLVLQILLLVSQLMNLSHQASTVAKQAGPPPSALAPQHAPARVLAAPFPTQLPLMCLGKCLGISHGRPGRRSGFSPAFAAVWEVNQQAGSEHAHLLSLFQITQIRSILSTGWGVFTIKKRWMLNVRCVYANRIDNVYKYPNTWVSMNVYNFTYLLNVGHSVLIYNDFSLHYLYLLATV